MAGSNPIRQTIQAGETWTFEARIINLSAFFNSRYNPSRAGGRRRGNGVRRGGLRRGQGSRNSRVAAVASGRGNRYTGTCTLKIEVYIYLSVPLSLKYCIRYLFLAPSCGDHRHLCSVYLGAAWYHSLWIHLCPTGPRCWQ